MQPSWIIRDEEIRARLMVAIAQLDLTVERPWVVTIKPLETKRSLAQNNFYWHMLGKMAEFQGDSISSLHDDFRREFLPVTYSEDIHGDMRERLTSTTKLNAGAMSDYIEQVRMFAIQEWGFVVPVLDEVG